jgi:16S rRNA processing protein RimM
LSKPGAQKLQIGDKILHIAKLGRAQGLRGEVRATVLSSDQDRLATLSSCLLVAADEQSSQPAAIESVRPNKGAVVIVKLAGIDNRNQAEKLNGCFLSVEREQSLVLQAYEWFVADLIGCAVTDEKLGYLGVVREILQNRSQDVYVVAQPGKPDLLFPALRSVLRRVDIVGRQIETRLPEGLYEVYRGEGT